MKIAVTGHLGTIGRPLVKALRAKGHEVIGIDLRHDADGVRADVADMRQLSAAVPADIDLMYHLAAEFGRYNGEHFYEQLWRTNAIGTKNVLMLQKERGFRLVFASSSEVYGERPAARWGNGELVDQVWLSEDLPLNPFYLSNDYAISKLVNEGQIQNAQKQWGSEIMTLRFFNAYGPGELYHSYRSVVCLFTYRALKELPYTVYEGYHRVFQYIDDLVATLARCPERFTPGLIANVGGTEYVSVHDLHDMICQYIPEAAEHVTFLPEEKHNVVSKRPHLGRARIHLAHEPSIPLKAGVPATIEWMREQYS